MGAKRFWKGFRAGRSRNRRDVDRDDRRGTRGRFADAEADPHGHCRQNLGRGTAETRPDGARRHHAPDLWRYVRWRARDDHVADHRAKGLSLGVVLWLAMQVLWASLSAAGAYLERP